MSQLDALFILQDATAEGRRDAVILQKKLLPSIRVQIAEVEPSQSNGLASHVAAYVLSGGDPSSATSLLNSNELTSFNRRMLEGSYHFMRGDRREAAELLGDLDLRLLPARVVGRIALAQALLEKDSALKQARFSRAVAIMPGTLVEESALRRSALAAAEARMETLLWRRLERYQRRFPASIYAQAFWGEILTVLARWNGEQIRPDVARLDLVMQKLPASLRRQHFLHLVRESSRIGNREMTTYAASRLKRLAVEGSAEEQSASLYLAAHAIASEGGETATRILRSINSELLGTEERALLAAGLRIANNIDRPPVANLYDAQDGLPQDDALQRKADPLISDVERLLGENNT